MTIPIPLPRGRRVTAALCTLLVMCLSPAWAQAPVKVLPLPAAPVPAPTATIEVIAPADIAVRADSDERLFHDAVVRAGQPDRSAEFQAELDAQIEGAISLSARFRDSDLSSLSTARLTSLERYWTFYRQQLTGWRERVQGQMRPYSELAAELAHRRLVWTATQKSAGTDALAPTLQKRIEFMIAQAERSEGSMSLPLARLIELSRRGNAVQSSIDDGLMAVSAAIGQQDSILARLDARPLWEQWQVTVASQDGLRDTAAGLAMEKQFLREYATTYQQRLRIQHVVALALLPFLLWLRHRTRKRVVGDQDLEDCARILLRPLSTWLALVMITAVVLDPDAPMLGQQLALLIALIPVLRLLPHQVFALLGPAPYLAAPLYLLTLSGSVLLAEPFWFRVYMLGVCLAALFAVLWLMYRLRSTLRDRTGMLPRVAAHGFCWLAIATLFVAAIANVLGNVSLAVMLTKATINSACVALVLYAALAIIGLLFKLAIPNEIAARFNGLALHTGPLLRTARGLLLFGTLTAWTVITLSEFRVLGPVSAWLEAVLTYRIEAGEVTLTLQHALLFAAAVFLSFLFARVVRAVLDDEVLPKMALPRGVGNSISTLSYYALVLLGLLWSLAVIGFQVSELAIVFGALGVGIGFGLQDVANNFVSGLILMFERPIQPGDVVEIAGHFGTVREIGMRATRLKTFEGADVVVPNGTLLSEKLINWTLRDRHRRLEVTFSVAEDSDPRQVIELLRDVAHTMPEIARLPAPVVLFRGQGNNSLEFALQAWTHDIDAWVRTRSELTLRVHDALKAADVRMPLNQLGLVLQAAAPDAAAQLSAERLRSEPA